MNFSIQRLIKLLKRDILINSKVFALLIISLMLLVSIIMFISTEEYCNSDNYINIIDVIFFVGIFMSGTIFSASIFTEFRQPGSRSQYLGLPATTKEKWLSKWLLSVPIHLLISFSLIIFSYLIMSHILQNVWPECSFLTISEISSFDLIQRLKIYFVFQAFCFLCGIIFNKHVLLKTLASSVVTMFLFSAIMTFITRFIFGLEPDPESNINLEGFLNISYIITPLLWFASYYKLKEKQL